MRIRELTLPMWQLPYPWALVGVPLPRINFAIVVVVDSAYSKLGDLL